MADTLDLLSLAEAKAALNHGSGSTHDTELALYITGISRRIDVLCGPVVVRTITGELHDGSGSCHRGCSPRRLWLRQTPVDAVDTVTEYVGTTGTVLTAESNATKPASGYLLIAERHNVQLIRRTGNSDSLFASGRRNVEIDYDAGRYDTTANVDELFKQAATSILRRIWSREAGAWATGSDPFESPGTAGFFRAVDPMVKEWLHDELTPAQHGLLVG